MITTLSPTLAPLPVNPQDSDETPAWHKSGGFVDEDKLIPLIGTPLRSRCIPRPEDLVLSADDEDFAGWTFPVATATAARTIPFRDAPHPDDFAPAPSENPEPGLDAPHRGASRWWLAGCIGASCTLFFSFLLLTLSWRPSAIASGAPAPAATASETRAALPPVANAADPR